jgi:hypothetical protein
MIRLIQDGIDATRPASRAERHRFRVRCPVVAIKRHLLEGPARARGLAFELGEE